MNGLLILLLSALVLAGGYWLYSRWIERSWGIEHASAPPAVRRRDGKEYFSTRSWLLFAHEFVSICAVLTVFGPIQAARWGWVPVLAWILLGGVLVGGVLEYCVVYTTVKSRGLTLGGLFGKFTGVRWKKVFLVFAWLLCVVAIAAFADIAARTLDGFSAVEEADPVRGRAGTVVILMYAFALMTGLAGRYSRITTWGSRMITVTILVCAIMLGMLFPVSLQPSLWHVIILSLALVSAAGPVWLTLHPRAQLHTYLYSAALLLLLAGLIMGSKTMRLPAYTGFSAEGQGLFPWLFVTLTCGAVSGLQALTASCVISRQVRSESRMRRVAFGGVMVQCFVAVFALVCVGTQTNAAALSAAQDPGALFLSATAGILSRFGISADLSGSIYTLLIACLCIGALETLARAARVCWVEFFDNGEQEPSTARYILSNGWLGAGVTLLAAFGLARLGYSALWPLFGSAVQALGGLALLICAVWLRSTRRTCAWIWLPMLLLLAASLTALALVFYEAVTSISGGSAHLFIDLLRAVLALAVFVVTVLLGIQALRGIRKADAPPEE